MLTYKRPPTCNRKQDRLATTRTSTSYDLLSEILGWSAPPGRTSVIGQTTIPKSEFLAVRVKSFRTVRKLCVIVLITIRISITESCTPAADDRKASASLDDTNSSSRANEPSTLSRMRDAISVSLVSWPCVIPRMPNCICKKEQHICREHRNAHSTIGFNQ